MDGEHVPAFPLKQGRPPTRARCRGRPWARVAKRARTRTHPIHPFLSLVPHAGLILHRASLSTHGAARTLCWPLVSAHVGKRVCVKTSPVPVVSEVEKKRRRPRPPTTSIPFHHASFPRPSLSLSSFSPLLTPGRHRTQTPSAWVTAPPCGGSSRRRPRGVFLP